MTTAHRGPGPGPAVGPGLAPAVDLAAQGRDPEAGQGLVPAPMAPVQDPDPDLALAQGPGQGTVEAGGELHPSLALAQSPSPGLAQDRGQDQRIALQMIVLKSVTRLQSPQEIARAKNRKNPKKTIK